MFNFTKFRIKIISKINPGTVTDNTFVGNKQVTHFRTYKIISSTLNIAHFGTVVFTNRPLHHFELEHVWYCMSGWLPVQIVCQDFRVEMTDDKKTSHPKNYLC